MADQQTDESTQPEIMEEPFLSNLDIFLFSLIVGLVIYWFVFRKKPEAIPDFRPLEHMATLSHYRVRRVGKNR
ncbi:P450 (cytochrome) oxidoreductase b isoform X1 [Tachysurus ichikawai]